jgi:hypothetical protein
MIRSKNKKRDEDRMATKDCVKKGQRPANIFLANYPEYFCIYEIGIVQHQTLKGGSLCKMKKQS